MLEPRYSGENSEAFWELVNLIDDKDMTLYELGCKLQSLEQKVLFAVNKRSSYIKELLKDKPIAKNNRKQS